MRGDPNDSPEVDQQADPMLVAENPPSPETPLGVPIRAQKKLAVPPPVVRKKLRQARKNTLRTLAIDIGGSGIKMVVLDEGGKMLTTRARVATPQSATPHHVFTAIQKLARQKGRFDRVSVGFPGVVKDGVVYTAPNLGPQWKNCKLEKILRQKLHRPVRASNDADVQGFGVIRGKGVEMVITLGTGVGSALFVNGILVPNLELGHHPFIKGKTYEEKLGHAALEKSGKKKWNKRLKEAIAELHLIFNYDTLYLSGGNTKYIRFKLPPNTKVVSNEAGLWGGIALWKDGTLRGASLAIV
jgi:polyphosphate glucokinase